MSRYTRFHQYGERRDKRSFRRWRRRRDCAEVRTIESSSMNEADEPEVDEFVGMPKLHDGEDSMEYLRRVARWLRERESDETS